MPAYLSDGSRAYNQIKRIQPRDSMAQLAYYYPYTNELSPSPSSSSSSIGTKKQHKESSVNIASVSSTKGCESMTMSSSSDDNNIRRRRNGKISDPNDIKRVSDISKNRNEAIIDAWITSDLQSPIKTSGFSEGNQADLTISKVFRFLDDPKKSNKFKVNKSRRELSSGHKFLNGSLITKRIIPNEMLRANDSQNEYKSPSIVPFEFNQRTRMKRRNIGRSNRRILLRNDNYYFDPYALSELFSQSEIPGFREIFASDSYLRKFCWIVAFLFMTVLSLNDMTELITEYYEYPITVGVRLRDSARLTFPSVTVCNLNIVRYSALCGSALNSRYNLTNQIPSELRDRLCGIQVDNKNASDTDISDINNIGITTTTTTSTTTTVKPNAFSSTSGSPDSSPTESGNTVASISSANIPDTSTLILEGDRKNETDTTKQNDVDITTRPTPTRSSSPTKSNGALDLGDFPEGENFLKRPVSSKVHPKRVRKKRTIETSANGRPFASKVDRVSIGDSHLNKLSGKRPAINSNHGISPLGIRSGPAGNQAAVTVSPGFSIPITQSSLTTSSPKIVSSSTSNPSSVTEDFEYTERIERELQNNLTNWLAVMYNRDPKLTWSLGHQFEDMILRCSMRYTNCTRQRSFENSFTPTEGNCFTYRSRARRVQTSSTGSKSNVLYDEVNLAGINQGLELVLNLEKNEYIYGSSQVGALVIVHHPGLGYAASEATFIAPEYTTYIGLKMVNITRLKSPYPENCVDSWPTKFADKLIRNSTYSQQACLKICLQKTIQMHCQCQSAIMPIVELDQPSSGNVNSSTERQRIIICDTRREATRFCVQEVMSRAAERVHNCDCPPKCQVVRYDKTVSMAKWPTREDKVTFDRGKMDVNFQNLAKVIVYFQTMTCDEVEQHPVSNPAKLFSALGGIMGMYVGFSFLSVFEIFEVISRKTWHHFRVKMSNKQSRRRWSTMNTQVLG